MQLYFYLKKTLPQGLAQIIKDYGGKWNLKSLKEA